MLKSLIYTLYFSNLPFALCPNYECLCDSNQPDHSVRAPELKAVSIPCRGCQDTSDLALFCLRGQREANDGCVKVTLVMKHAITNTLYQKDIQMAAQRGRACITDKLNAAHLSVYSSHSGTHITASPLLAFLAKKEQAWLAVELRSGPLGVGYR